MPGRKQVLCFAVASSFFLSLDCKKLLWWPPTWPGMHTYTEKSGLPGPSGVALLRRKPGGLGRRLLVASSDEIFFFFLFFCLFHFFEIFTATGEEERGKERRPPRERSKPRTHSPGRSRPKICSPDSQAHRIGTAQIWPPLWAGGPSGSCASSGVTPREGVIGCT